MAVTEVELTGAGTSGEAEGSPSGGSVSGGFTVQYRVWVQSPVNDTAVTVLRHFRNTPSLPYIGRPFRIGDDQDTSVAVTNIKADYVENSGGQYLVNVAYKSKELSTPPSIPPDQDDEDPILWHDDIDVAFMSRGIPVEKAIFRGFENATGKADWMQAGQELPVTNSARIPYDPPLEEEEHIKVIRMTKNVPSYDDSFFDKFQGATNSDEVVIVKPDYGFKTSFKPYQGMLRVSGVFMIENNTRFWKRTIEIHVRKKGWRRALPDEGFHELYKAGDKDVNDSAISASQLSARDQFEYRPITSGEEQPILVPVLLNGQGKKLRPSYKPVYGIWTTKEEIAFAGIDW